MKDIILKLFGDHGADSSRRDRFQEHFAAALCIEMLADPSILEVICEYGEDVVLKRNGAYELFQVKTKQESVSDWKIADLIPIIGKTLAMTPYFENVSKCCFVSNEGASGVLFQLKTLLNMQRADWNLDDCEFFEGFCRNHVRSLLKEIKNVDKSTKIDEEDIPDLLLKLEIHTDYHHMEHIQDTNMRKLRQYLEGIGEYSASISDEALADSYDRLLGLVGKATIGRDRSEKSIHKALVIGCIYDSKSRRTSYSFPTKDEIDEAPGKTRLEKKLHLGGFTPLFIDSSRETMVTVMAKARKWDFGEAAVLLEDIRFRMRHLGVESYDKICSADPNAEALGREILEDIKSNLPLLMEHYERAGLPFIDEIFLEGILMCLTSECRFYWSQHPPR